MCHGFVFLKWVLFFCSLTWWPFTLLYVQVFCSSFVQIWMIIWNIVLICFLSFFFLVNCDKLPRTNWTANSNAAVCQNMFGSWSLKTKKKNNTTFKETDVKGGRLVTPVCFNSCKLKTSSPYLHLKTDYQYNQEVYNGQRKCWFNKTSNSFHSQTVSSSWNKLSLSLEGEINSC